MLKIHLLGQEIKLLKQLLLFGFEEQVTFCVKKVACNLVVAKYLKGAVSDSHTNCQIQQISAQGRLAVMFDEKI